MGIWASLWTSIRSVPCSRRGCTRSKRIPRNKLSADGVFRYERTAFPPQGRAVSPCGSWETAQEPSPMRAHSHATGSIMNQAAFRTPPCAGGYVIQLASRICGFQSRSLGYTKGFPVPVLRSLFQIAFICGPQPMFAASRCAESCISAYPNGLELAGPARGITRFFIHKMFYYKYQYNTK